MTQDRNLLVTLLWIGIGFFVSAAAVIAWHSLPDKLSPQNDTELDASARNGAEN